MHYLTDEGLDELVKNTYQKDLEIKNYIGSKPDKITLHTGEEIATPNIIAYINAKFKDFEGATRLETTLTKISDETPDLDAIEDYYDLKGYDPSNGDIILIANNGKEYLYIEEDDRWEEYGDQNMYVPKTMIVTQSSNGIMTATDKTNLDSLWSRKIAGVSLQSDVDADTMKTGLGLATVASSGAYGDLSGTPESLPANGGNSSTVNGHTVETNVPAGAVFTDTNTWRPLGTGASDACAGNDSRLSDSRPANGGNADTVDNKHASDFATSGHNHDGVYLKGITKADVTNALGYTPPTQDTNTWRPLGTGAEEACAGNDSRLSNARKADGGNADSAGKVNHTLSFSNTIIRSNGEDYEIGDTFNGSADAIYGITIVDRLDNTSKSACLSANMGKSLNDSKVSKSGDTMTGILTMKSGISMYGVSPIDVRHINGCTTDGMDGDLFLNYSSGKDIWLGTKENGLYRITDNGSHFTGYSEYIQQGKTQIIPQYCTVEQSLQLQADQNLVLYVNGSAVWSTQTSSARFKHNIQDMTEERAKQILNIRPVTFDYNEDQPCPTRKTDKAGVIAEEVANVMDDVVVYEVKEDGSKIERTVEYSYFTPYLIKMVQMQQKEIEELKAIINEKLQ